MSSHDRIVIDPAVAHGKPVIRGTRVTVTSVVGALADGMSFEDVQRDYDLTADDVRAALRFVGELAAGHSICERRNGTVGTRQVGRKQSLDELVNASEDVGGYEL